MCIISYLQFKAPTYSSPIIYLSKKRERERYCIIINHNKQWCSYTIDISYLDIIISFLHQSFDSLISNDIVLHFIYYWNIAYIVHLYKSNVTATNYFIIFLQNIDVANLLLVFIIGFHINSSLISHFHLLIITHHISSL